jgi:hypothetical protein
VAAVALLETLSGDWILSLGAAAVAELVEHHFVSGDNGGGICLLGAVAAESCLSVNNGISAATPDHVSIWGGKLLTQSKRGVGDTACAVLSINSIECCLVETCALLTGNKLDGGRLVGTITDVDKGLSCGIIDLSAIASLK